MKYANIIVDISVEKLDKTFQYSIPENLQEEIQVGVQVDIPFGNRKLTGYVIELTEDAEFDPRRIRPIISVHEGSVARIPAHCTGRMDAEELRFHHESGTKDRTPDPQADERSTEAGDCITDSEDRGAAETGTL